MMKNLKLNTLAQNAMKEKEMHQIKGGAGCGCSCYYANSGGSSSADNGCANSAHGWYSHKGTNEAYVCA
jgi:natural product precursor